MITNSIDNWSRTSHPMMKDEFGVFSIEIPFINGECPIKHGSRVKIHFQTENSSFDRIPSWSQRVIQDSETGLFETVWWADQQYEWKCPTPIPPPQTPLIYEAHIGISTPKEGISSFKDFTTTVLPRVSFLGYNTIQLMAIQEHAYYGSFGYQVTSFFAPSSRFGTPNELKMLIDEAHSRGIRVLLDVVHSHSSKNSLDGLNLFDGSDSCYHHSGPRGTHTGWDSRLFDYGKREVLRFLLSNLIYWIEEFKFDGFRFDGVTSMLYRHHGLNYTFTGNYMEYFGEESHCDLDAIMYLQLANYLLHSKYPFITTIAEDVSGMPLLCCPVSEIECGIGFDYRLGMSTPDNWIRLLKSVRDEDWDLSQIIFCLLNRRDKESTISYAESHDQALVGDKTIAFWLMDSEMYCGMSLLSGKESTVIARGIALHKMIRLITFSLGGEGYLTFMGNEFGHPEWLDFPREGNCNSYFYCRRQFNLADRSDLRYKFLQEFDRKMLSLLNDFDESCDHLTGKKERQLNSAKPEITLINQRDMIVAWEGGLLNGGCVCIMNWNPKESFSDFRIGVSREGCYRLRLSSDSKEFGGQQRVLEDGLYFTSPIPWDSKEQSISVYIPSRTAIVLSLVHHE